MKDLFLLIVLPVLIVAGLTCIQNRNIDNIKIDRNMVCYLNSTNQLNNTYRNIDNYNANHDYCK